MKRGIQWTDDMRTTLMLLRMQTKYKDNSEKVTAIFNHMFASELREAGYDTGIEKKRLVDAWNSRKMSGRGRQWLTVDAPPKNVKEMVYRQGLLRQIHQAASDIAASDDGVDNAGEELSEIETESDNEDSSETKGDAQTPDAMDMSDDDLNSRSEASHEGAEEMMQKGTGYQALDMIHKRNVSWDEGDPSSSSTAFIDHEDPLYKLGGRVYRVIIKSTAQDVMICNRSQCARCSKTKIDKSLLDKSTSKTQGLPFVHATDLEVITRVGFQFKQDISKYSAKYPDDQWKTRVTFSDGVQREVSVCVAAKCSHCSGKEAVDRRAARYLPGGDLYKLKRAIERASET